MAVGAFNIRIMASTLGLNGAISKVNKLNTAMMTVGGVAAGASIATGLMARRMAQGLASASKESAEFGDVMALTAAKMQLSADEADRMAKFVRQIGIESRFSNTQVAQATEQLAQMGVSMREAQNMLPSVLNLAVAGDMDPRQAAETLRGAMNAGVGEIAKDAERAASAIVTVQNRTNLAAKDILNASTAFSAAQAANVPFEEMLVLLAASRNAMNRASRAGTNFSNAILQSIKKADNLTAKGIRLYDPAQGEADAMRFAKDLDDLSKTMSAEDYSRFLVDTFGLRGMRQITASSAFEIDFNNDGQIDELERGAVAMQRLVAEIRDPANAGAAAEFADTMNKTAAGTFAIFAGIQKSIKETFGDAVNKFVVPIVQRLNIVLAAFANRIAAMPDGMKRLLGGVLVVGTGLMGLVAVLLGVAGAALIFASAWPVIAGAFSTVAATIVGSSLVGSLVNIGAALYGMLAPLSGAGMLFLGLAAAFVKAAFKTGMLAEGFKALWSLIKIVAQPFIILAGVVGGILAGAFDLLLSLFNQVSEALEPLAQLFAELFSYMSWGLDGATGRMWTFKQAFEGLREVINGILPVVELFGATLAFIFQGLAINIRTLLGQSSEDMEGLIKKAQMSFLRIQQAAFDATGGLIGSNVLSTMEQIDKINAMGPRDADGQYSQSVSTSPAGSAPTGMAGMPKRAGGGFSDMSSRKQTNNIKVDIQGNGDPDKIAKAIGIELDKRNGDMLSQTHRALVPNLGEC